MGKFDEQEKQKTFAMVKELHHLIEVANCFIDQDQSMISLIQFHRYIAECHNYYEEIEEMDKTITELKQSLQITIEKKAQLEQVLKDLGM
jgi:hypothetical protein